MNMYGMGKLEMFAIYMDITTGDTLFTERYVEEFEPEMPGILFSEAVEMAQQVLDSVGVSATILGGEMYFGSEMYNNDGPDGEDYGFNGTSLSSRMGELRLNSSSLGLPMVLGEHEHDTTSPGPGMMPMGYSDWWNVYAYDSSLDSVIVMDISPEGVWDAYMIGDDEVEEEEIDFSLMQALPETYINSDSAMILAEGYGGQMFRDEYSMMSEEEFAGWELNLRAVHEYWSVPDEDPSAVPVMWIAEYYGGKMNMYGMGKLEMFAIYMDITTGDTLFTERYVEEFEPEMPGILFSEAVEMAQQVLDSVGVSATILGGETLYEYSTLDLDLSELELEHGIHLMPMGYSEWWSIYAYEPASDSILVLEVEMDGVWEVYTVGEDDMDESIDFSILKALPEDYMDSNELMMMIAESDYDLENFMTDATLPEYAYMDFSMDLRIIHDYWSFPIDLAPELIPVTWNMTLHGSLMDSLDQTMMSDSLSVYIHSTEGELLYASLDLTNSEQENTVPESVVLYQNYPNPFNPTTSISFELNKAQDVSLVVYNLLGQKVLTLVNDRLESGQHRININASNLASGIYMYRLITNSQSLTKKMTLIK